MLSTQELNEIIVGWDSEYNAVDGNYVPICDQLYCNHCNRPYFLSHVGRRISSAELLTPFFADHPDIHEIRLVCHYNKAELFGLAEGADILFHQDSNFIAVQKGLFGAMSLDIAGVPRTINLSDTFLLYPTSLEKLGQACGLPKLETHGHRESDDMLTWYYSEPAEFEDYAVNDALITAKAYQMIVDKLVEYDLPVRNTVGSIFENYAHQQLKTGNFQDAGYMSLSRENVRVNCSGKMSVVSTSGV